MLTMCGKVVKSKKLVVEVEKDNFELPYQIVTNKLKEISPHIQLYKGSPGGQPLFFQGSFLSKLRKFESVKITSL